MKSILRTLGSGQFLLIYFVIIFAIAIAIAITSQGCNKKITYACEMDDRPMAMQDSASYYIKKIASFPNYGSTIVLYHIDTLQILILEQDGKQNLILKEIPYDKNRTSP